MNCTKMAKWLKNGKNKKSEKKSEKNEEKMDSEIIKYVASGKGWASNKCAALLLPPSWRKATNVISHFLNICAAVATVSSVASAETPCY